MINALEAREMVNGKNSTILNDICRQVERKARQGKTITYYKTTANKEALAEGMRQLGFKSWATAQSVAVQW